MNASEVLDAVERCIGAILREASEQGLSVGTGVRVLKDGRCCRCIVPSREGSPSRSLLVWAHPPCGPGQAHQPTPELRQALEESVRRWCQDAPPGGVLLERPK